MQLLERAKACFFSIANSIDYMQMSYNIHYANSSKAILKWSKMHPFKSSNFSIDKTQSLPRINVDNREGCILHCCAKYAILQKPEQQRKNVRYCSLVIITPFYI